MKDQIQVLIGLALLGLAAIPVALVLVALWVTR